MATSALKMNNLIGGQMSTQETINLTRMVHLALNSSPNVGIVNFNILKSFLLKLLEALNLQNYEPKFGEDNDIVNLLDDAIKTEEQNDSIHLSEKGADTTGKQNMSILTGDMVPLTLERFHAVEDKLGRLEHQISALNAFPTNQQIIQKSKELNRGSNHNSGPILEIWQYTQLSKRQESNEEGITKLTSLLQDLIGEINELRDGQQHISDEFKRLNSQYEHMASQLKSLDNLKNILPSLDGIERDIKLLKSNNFDGLVSQIEEISKKLRDLERKSDSMVTLKDLEGIVRWNDLENALMGLKLQLNAQREQDHMRDQRQTQTTPGLMNSSPNNINLGESKLGKEFEELLAKLGTLNDRHEDLKSQVDNLRLEMGNKSSGGFSLPEDFSQKMDDLKNLKLSLEELKNNFNNESNKRIKLENMISNLDKEIDSIKNSIKELLTNAQLREQDINNLKEALRALEESKADKNWIQMEINMKADTKDLNNKVNKKLFEDKNTEVENSLKEFVLKHNSLEDELKRNSDILLKELEGKLDRLELDSLKDYIEKQLRRLKKFQKENSAPIQTTQIASEDDAAGLRKQLLRFHCISCDRPIELSHQHGVVPSLPAEKGMRPIQTPRPYTTYELDQIRQFQKQQFQETSYDLFSSVRQCGGSHTLTIPHKKLLKLPQPDEAIQQMAMQPVVTKHKSEVQIQGQDGQIYKGRIDAKLNIEMKKPVRNRGIKSAQTLDKSLNNNDENDSLSTTT